MSAADGTVIGAVKIVDNGDPAERFNLVLVAEGYQKKQLDDFAEDAQHFVNGFLNIDPFSEFPCAFNIWRLDVASDQSGADDPKACGGTGKAPRTYFDAHFCTGGLRRALTCNTSLVLQTVAAHVSQFHSAQVIVNSSVYGGTGGVVGTASTAKKNSKGQSIDWRNILIHEMGHSVFGLGDEYFYWAGCDVNEPNRNHHAASEPFAPNLTISPTATGKWSDLINTPTLPTSTNPDCTKCPPDISPAPSSSIVGTFEGAHYAHCGAYRPSYECKMRVLDAPFCAVCQRVIAEYLLPFEPELCLKEIFDQFDPNRWAVVATILFGVVQDGGGVVIVGGKPIPIDPWGPLRHSLWGALASPRTAAPALRDAAVALALARLTPLLSKKHRGRLEKSMQQLLDDVAEQLPSYAIR